MKRLNNLFDSICTIERINEADNCARRGKKNWGIVKHDRNRELDNVKLLEALKSLQYKTSEYKTFTIYEPKERLVFRLPYYPDRIAHWAIMLTMEPIWTKVFTKNTYSSIKGRGIHKLYRDLKKALKDEARTRYCLKLDIRKFYPSIDHEVLKQIIRKKIKDTKLLYLLDNIIDSAKGVPIGNYLSQFFANLYMTYFDHWVKETLRIKYYFRYADDLVFLSDNKNQLHYILNMVKEYLDVNLKMFIKPNYQVFPVDSQGIDFVGYVFTHKGVKLRKSIKKRLFRLVLLFKNKTITRAQFIRRISSYKGWTKYCSSNYLLNMVNKLITDEKLY